MHEGFKHERMLYELYEENLRLTMALEQIEETRREQEVQLNNLQSKHNALLALLHKLICIPLEF